MKRVVLFIVALFVTLGSIDCYASDINILKKNKKVKYVEHIVNVGESLYNILNRYEVKYSDIKADNPNISPEKCEPGSVIKINKALVKSASASEIDEDYAAFVRSIKEKQELAEQNRELKKDVQYMEHKVSKGETLFSISQKYKITVAQLSQMNRETLKESNGVLKEGSVLRIGEGVDVRFSGEETVKSLEAVTSDRLLKTFSASKPAKIIMLLPLFSKSGSVENQFVEFYQGALLALDSIKSRGMSVDLRVLDTGRELEKVNTIINSGDLNDADLIIGPIFDEQYSAVAQYAALRSIPMVSPLAPVTTTYSESFQISPSDKTKYEKLESKIQDKNVIYVTSIDDDQEFLSAVGAIVKDDSLSMDYNPKLQPEAVVTNYLVSDRPNLFVVAAKRENIADEILSKLSSVRTFANHMKIEVLCSSQIARVTSINPATMFRLDLSYVTPYYVTRTDQLVMSFDNKYISAFGSTPSLYSYRGYDVTLLFAEAMERYGSDFVKFMDNYSSKPLSVEYTFDKASLNEGYINNFWNLVNFAPNYKITIK